MPQQIATLTNAIQALIFTGMLTLAHVSIARLVGTKSARRRVNLIVCFVPMTQRRPPEALTKEVVCVMQAK